MIGEIAPVLFSKLGAALAASPEPNKETTMQIDAATRDLCARAIFGELAPDDQLWDSLTDDEREQYRLAVDRVAAFAASPEPKEGV